MIDFHSHILPGIDDGSHSTAQSLEMLEASAKQGVDVICATPHFYPTTDDPEHFLENRSASWEGLSKKLTQKMPRVVLGAEVYYFGGIAQSDIISDLRIGKSELLLLEMPFSSWTSSMVREIVALNDRTGIRVVLAHIERYLKFQDARVWEYLRDNGVVMQSNSHFFTSWKTKRRAKKMLLSGQIDLIGSDCHNTTSRPQDIGDAFEIIGELGRETVKRNSENFFSASL